MSYILINTQNNTQNKFQSNTNTHYSQNDKNQSEKRFILKKPLFITIILFPSRRIFGN